MIVSSTADVSGTEAVPTTMALRQNYPNPFNPSTQIAYELPGRSHVTIRVYDLLGKVVTTIIDEQRPAGRYVATWNASDLPSGIYFCRMTAESFTRSMKMVLMK